MNKFFLIAVLILVVLSQMATPSERKIKYGKLSIIHQEGKIENKTHNQKGQREPDPFNASNEYIIHIDEQISVEIKDPNFFLYEYKWKGITMSKTEDFTALDNFIEAFIGIEKKLETITPPSKKEKKLEDVITDTGTKINELKSKLIAQQKKSKKPDNLDEKIKALEEGEKLIKDIEKIGITDSFNDLSAKIKNLSEMVQKIPDLICQISKGLDGAKDANAEIEKWGSDEEEKAIIAAYGKIKEALRIISESTDVIAKLDENEKIRENIQFISETLLIFTVREFKVMEMIEKVNAFKSKFREMYNKKKNQCIPFPLGTAISYSEKEKIVVDIEISMVDKIPEEVKKCLDLKKEAKKTGTFQIVFEPYTPVKISFGLAEILSSFKEKKEGDENEKNIKLTIPTITITPNFKLWEIKSLRLGFQVGGMVKDKANNILMGAGLQLVERIFIGGGLHLRWSDEINLKAGWYINIGLNVLSAKL